VGATSKLYLSDGLREENYVVGTHKYEAPLSKIWLPWLPDPWDLCTTAVVFLVIMLHSLVGGYQVLK